MEYEPFCKSNKTYFHHNSGNFPNDGVGKVFDVRANGLENGFSARKEENFAIKTSLFQVTISVGTESVHSLEMPSHTFSGGDLN